MHPTPSARAKPRRSSPTGFASIRGRVADSRPHAHAVPLIQKYRRRAARVSCPLQQRHGAVQLSRGDQLGVDTLHTAIPPLANGSLQPSIFNIAANARALGFKPLVDLEAIKPVEQHFTFIAKREGHPSGAQREYDHAQYLHQVPGGMISNLRHQLRTMGMENRLQETLEEAGRVRADSAIRSW